MTAPAIDMETVAALCGYSWERFRKVWRQLPGFPAPIKRPSLTGKGSYAWLADDVVAWRDARKRAHASPSTAEAANDRHHVVLADRAATARQRKALGRLLARA